MSPSSFWITGSTRSGKTARLIELGLRWQAEQSSVEQSVVLQSVGRSSYQINDQPSTLQNRLATPPGSVLLVMAATGETRIDLMDRLLAQTQGRLPVESTTPLGFIQSEVQLFWPLLRQQLDISTQFPIRLRPEKEQELATQLWQSDLEQGRLQMDGVSEFYQVRRILDLVQLAAFAMVPLEDIPTLMTEGWTQTNPAQLWQTVGEAILHWRSWCLEQGLLSYGLMTDLYWQYLLPHPLYQERLRSRFWGVLADDVDEYPAIAHAWFSCLLDQGAVGAFTFNPDGQVRLGQGADPPYIEQLAGRCEIIALEHASVDSLGFTWSESIINWVQDPFTIEELPEPFTAIQETSRAQLLRRLGEAITHAVQTGQVEPKDIAIIGPGLDPIARYTLTEILSKQGIPITILNDQRPLISSPIVRSLLTLLCLIYPNLGRWIDREAIAEMLIVFSQTPAQTVGQSWIDLARIDPVRAELLADHCFEPHPNQPKLLPMTAFSRWDRLGHQAAEAYESLLNWLNDQIQQQQQRLIPSVVALLDRAIQQFLWRGSHLPYDQLAVLRELIETAQHYWDVEGRLRREDDLGASEASGASGEIADFIQLLRSGAVSADPYPAKPVEQTPPITLATVYQYRARRLSHRWQFWLDASSPRWLTGDDSRYGAPVFWRDRPLHPWTAEDTLNFGEARLRRILLDLLARTSDRVILCHSDLSTSGQDQTGPLQTLVNAAQGIESEGVRSEE
ncbi:MAG: hypothetical protein ACTS2F_01765 [Thainema sp.]